MNGDRDGMVIGPLGPTRLRPKGKGIQENIQTQSIIWLLLVETVQKSCCEVIVRNLLAVGDFLRVQKFDRADLSLLTPRPLL